MNFDDPNFWLSVPRGTPVRHYRYGEGVIGEISNHVPKGSVAAFKFRGVADGNSPMLAYTKDCVVESNEYVSQII